MSTQKPSQASPAERVQNSYKQLSLAAADLNTASDELGTAISVWDAALKKLNLGVSAWAELSSGGDEPYWWDRSVGYTKLKDRWGIALRTREGVDPVDAKVETWPFNEAPRWMRIEGVGKLPDLLEALLKQAEDTTKKIKGKIAETYDLAKAIDTPAASLVPSIGPVVSLPAGLMDRVALEAASASAAALAEASRAPNLSEFVPGAGLKVPQAEGRAHPGPIGTGRGKR
jgi:hypothetical protein